MYMSGDVGFGACHTQRALTPGLGAQEELETNAVGSAGTRLTPSHVCAGTVPATGATPGARPAGVRACLRVTTEWCC